MTQLQLIDSILKDLHLQDKMNTQDTLTLSTQILHKDSEGPDINLEVQYHSVIGKLSFLERSPRPDIVYAIHQCAQFSITPKQSHNEAGK